MPQLKSISRVTIYCEEQLANALIQQCQKLGARGYTSVECKGGKGFHQMMEDPFVGHASRLRVEMLVDPEVAEKIIDALDREPFVSRPVLACIDPVKVSVRDHY